MKGLLVKDWELMKQQKKFFLMLAVIAILFYLSGSTGFAMGYFTVLSAFFTVTTISYDEYDNGYAFLMTLPMIRRDYAKEKYCLGILLTLTGWCAAMLLGLFGKGIGKESSTLEELLISGGMIIAIAVGMLAVILPMTVRYGAEKGRYIAIGFWGAAFAMIYGAAQLKVFSIKNAEHFFHEIPVAVLLLFVGLAAIGVYYISYRICVGMMEKKEF